MSTNRMIPAAHSVLPAFFGTSKYPILTSLLPSSSNWPKISVSPSSCQGVSRKGFPYHSSAVCLRIRSKKLQAASACGWEKGKGLSAPSELPGFSQTFLPDLLEGGPSLQAGMAIGQRLPALDDHIHIFGIEFQAVADPPGQFGRGQSRARSKERLIHQLAPLEVVEDRSPHQLDRLLRGVVKL